MDEVHGAENFGVHHHGDALLIPDFLDQGLQLRVLHLGSDGVIAQQTAVDGQGGVQGVEAGGDLHFLGVVHRVPVGHVDPGLLQRGPSIGEAILHHQVLGLLGVDEGGDKGVLGGDDGGHVLHSSGGQGILHHLGGAWGDLVDHGPGERHLLLVPHPSGELRGDVALLQPFVHHHHNAGFQLLTVVGAVVHADNSDGGAAGVEPLQQQGGGHAHGVGAVGRAVVEVGLDEGEELPVDILQSVALLGDGVAHHLEGRVPEDGLQPPHVLREGVPRPQALGDRGHHILLQGAVGQQRNHQGHVVKGGVDFVDDIVVEGVGGHNAALHQPLIQQAVLEPGDEAPEDVARAEVDPGGV